MTGARLLARRPAVERQLGDDGDGVLIDVAAQIAYVLNRTAWAIWELCDRQHSADEIIAELARRWGIDEEAVAAGCRRVLAFLERAELVVGVER
ncbi:MAG TPA: PqqD family protein [Actinomycetes bacterium]|nr:PqqD family protein [Actinomycetes bacterium]